MRHLSLLSARRRLMSCALLLAASGLAWEERIDVGQFSAGKLDNWKTESFSGSTRYRLQSLFGRGTVLSADSKASASGLIYKIDVDLNRTPYLHWSWKIDNLIAGADERSKGGDDYPARIYVLFSGGLLFWKTRAINYVWSSNQPIDSEWPNAYTGNSRMIAIRSGTDGLGEWCSEMRDVRADYRRLFNAEPGPVAAVALMTDTDNTGLAASAWYGDIWFTTDPAKLPRSIHKPIAPLSTQRPLPDSATWPSVNTCHCCPQI